MRRESLIRRALAPAVLIAAAALLLALMAMPAAAQSNVTYTVTVENLTSNQPFTPPVVAAHTSDIDLFEVGSPASAEIQALAENGNNDPLLTLAGGSSAVIDSAAGTAPIMPGETASLTLDAPAGSLISAAMMLICTNDGFTGVDSATLPASGSEVINANAYDAGTENNTEDFVDIVPPCQSLIGVTSDDAGTGETNPALAEGGVVAPHAGIQGGTDLTTADHGWTNPVARITVTAGTSSLPSSGGPPTSEGPGAWALYAAIGSLLLLAGGGVTFVAVRRREG